MKRACLIFLLLSAPVFAGTCPSGANYVSLTSPGANGNAGSVTLSSLGALQCYYISASGSDSNTGADESHPWLHSPQMSSATGTAASHTTVAGDAFIFEGGGTWHYTTGSPGTGGGITVSTSGTGTNPIFYTIDPTWFSGGSFARPIFSMDNPLSTAFVSSCTTADDNSNHFFSISGSHVIFDGFEFSGSCWNGNPSGNEFNETGTNNVVERMYMHGWTAGTSASDDTWRFVGGGGGTTNTYYYNVVDGSDSTAGTVCTTSSCVASVWNGSGTPSPIPATLWPYDDCGTLAYSVITHTSQGCQAGSLVLIHDNFFSFVFEPGYGRHGNVLETLSQSTGSFTAYNNVTANINEGENWNPAAPSMYIYNNVFVNDQHFPPDPNCMLLEPTGNNSSAVITVLFTNNSVDNTCAISAHSSTWASGSSITAENNHITNRTTFNGGMFGCGSGNTCTVTDNGGEVFQTTSVANGQGYTIANFWSPTLNTNGTVGAGNNLTSSCGTGGYTNDLCSERGSVSIGSSWGGEIAVYPAITINTRPSTGSWDSGAYEFAGSTKASSPTCTPGTGSYSSTQTVTCTNPNSGTTVMCYSFSTTPATNGAGTGCTTGTKYTTTLSVSSTSTLQIIAGTSTLSDSNVVSYTYTIAPQAATPVCTPGSGNYTSAQSASCSDSSSGAIMCYTVNGSTPATNGTSGCNTGTLYSTSISITYTSTLRVIAGGTGFTDSAVASYTYIAPIAHVTGACSKSGVETGASNSWTFSCTPSATNDAILVQVYCHASSGTISGVTLSAPGWTITQLVGPTTITGSGTAAVFGAVAPNASSTTFTATFTGASDCATYSSYMADEFSGNSTVGGTTTFNATGVSTGTSLTCNQTAANVTPPNANEAVWFGCYDNATAVTSPWVLGVSDGSGGDLTEYNEFLGSVSAQTPAYSSTAGNMVVQGVAINPSGSSSTITVSAITGDGIITSSDSVFNCGETATGSCVDSGIAGSVTLTATPATGFSFTSWGGGTCSGGSPTCTISSTATVTATFTPQAYPIGPQILVDNNEATDGSLAPPTYELSISTGNFIGPTPGGCSFNTPYSATCSSVQQAFNDIESCRTASTGNVGFYIDVPPPVIACANNVGLTVPQSSLNSTASSYIVVRSTNDSSLPVGQVVCDHGIQDNLITSLNIRLNNPDCTGQNMYYELGPTSSTPAEGPVNNASMSSITATFTLPSGITFPSSFTKGQFVRGTGFSPTGYNTYWQILSGGNGTSSMTAQACVSGTCVSGLSAPTSTNFTLTGVSVSGGVATYLGTITGGGSNAFDGMVMNVTGFVTSGNNVSCEVVSSTGTQFTCTATTQANETDPATAASITATLMPDNTLTGRTQLSVNTTTLTAIPATGNNYVLLANGYVPAGISVVIDTSTNQETVTTLSGPNQNGMIASFTKTHAAGVPVTFCATSCNYTLANGQIINTANYNDQANMWGVAASGTNPTVLTFCNAAATNGGAPYCTTSTAQSTVSGAMPSTTATFTAGSNYPAGFTSGNYLLGSSFAPSGYNTEWLISGGGTGSTSLTAVCVSGCSALGNTSVSGTLTLLSNIAPDHWMFEDGNFAMSAGNSGNSDIIELNGGGATATSQLATHIQFRKDWCHGDYSSLATGANEISTCFHLQGIYGSVLDSKISQALRPGFEGHGITFGMGAEWKLSNDVIEGNAIGMICGGFTGPTETIPGWLACSNMEIRKLLSTFPYHWLGMGAIPVSFNPHFANQESLVRKNALEFKQGEYVARVGVIGENVDDSGGQDGPYGDLNNWNSSGGSTGNNYQSTITNFYLADEIGRNLCTGYEFTSRGTGSFEASGGTTLLGGFILVSNDLFYNTSVNSNPNCPGANTGHDVGVYQIEWTGTVSRNSAGNVATFTATCAIQNNVSTCPPTQGFSQTDIAIGDAIVITGCTDTTFNTPTGTPTGGGAYVGPELGAYALSGTNGTSANGLTVVYGNSGTGGGSDTSGTCTLGYVQGSPLGLQMTHMTFVTDSTHTLTATNSKTNQSLNFGKYNLFRDSIWLGGGWYNNDLSEGTFTENGNWDSTTMTADHLVWVGRTASKYTEYCNNPNYTGVSGCQGSGNTSLSACNGSTCSTYFPATATMCGYWAGSSACTSGSQNLQVSDYHAFAIAASSPYFAGNSNNASDGTSMGANISAIDAAQTSNILVCPPQLNCGTPFPDVLTINVIIPVTNPPSGVSIRDILRGVIR